MRAIACSLLPFGSVSALIHKESNECTDRRRALQAHCICSAQ